jgi:hypothetical protein
MCFGIRDRILEVFLLLRIELAVVHVHADLPLFLLQAEAAQRKGGGWLVLSRKYSSLLGGGQNGEG